MQKVLDALSAAEAAGFDPKQGQLKVNSVIQRGKNEQELLPLAAIKLQGNFQLAWQIVTCQFDQATWTANVSDNLQLGFATWLATCYLH